METSGGTKDRLAGLESASSVLVGKGQVSDDLKEAQSTRYFELFWPRTELPLNERKPEIIVY